MPLCILLQTVRKQKGNNSTKIHKELHIPNPYLHKIYEYLADARDADTKIL